jgi:Nucleotidyl transferase AbiEii toxin, Type IV TA system
VFRDSLTPLQRRILRALAPLAPPWTLTGGGALAGVHLGHRETRDLDLFWRDRPELGPSPREAETALRADGLEVSVLRTAPAFVELRVSDRRSVCVVDLVAEPFGPVESPQRAQIEGVQIAVDTAHEILVNKLTALLSRSELRDLVDVKALLEAGGDLERALRDAPKKDGGFSPLTLAWVLKGFSPATLARALGVSAQETEEIVGFHRKLLEQVTALAGPE